MAGCESLRADEFQALAQELRAVFCWRDVGAEAHSAGKDEAQYFKDAAEPWTHIYKVPFEQVADLLRYRKVFMRGYIHSNAARNRAV
jgi:hypothetical protein